MGELADLARELQPLLREAADDAHVPAATLAFRRGDEVADLATGVLNLEARIAATTDSVFQIGSITKLFTATLVLQLVDEGIVDLDLPVREYVPEFAVADPAASAAITVRHLLCHTPGFDGDVFDDYGRGDDTAYLYVRGLAGQAQLSPPGAMFSYCNAGFVVLGRLVELCRKNPWALALRQHLLDPLGVTHAATVPEEALLFRAALGYMNPDDPDVPKPPRQWALGWSMQAAGSMLSFSARDLLVFAALHLADGRAESGQRVLSPAAVAAMRRPQITIPAAAGTVRACGLGFALAHWAVPGGASRLVMGHDGATLGGQAACLRIVPDAGVSVSLLMNGGRADDLIDTVVRRVLLELAGVEMPRDPVIPSEPVAIDAIRFVGRYEGVSESVDIRVHDEGELRSTVSLRGAIADEYGDVVQSARLRGFDATTLIQYDDRSRRTGLLAFPETDAHGRARYLHTGGRALFRAAD
jgi:CubicO group peptidase (beta-lactamase class C family)